MASTKWGLDPTALRHERLEQLYVRGVLLPLLRRSLLPLLFALRLRLLLLAAVVSLPTSLSRSILRWVLLSLALLPWLLQILVRLRMRGLAVLLGARPFILIVRLLCWYCQSYSCNGHIHMYCNAHAATCGSSRKSRQALCAGQSWPDRVVTLDRRPLYRLLCPAWGWPEGEVRL